VWERVKKLREEGKLSPESHDDDEPSALAFTPYDIEEEEEKIVEGPIVQREPLIISVVKSWEPVSDEDLFENQEYYMKSNGTVGESTTTTTTNDEVKRLVYKKNDE
jgi:hypothetical protein